MPNPENLGKEESHTYSPTLTSPVFSLYPTVILTFLYFSLFFLSFVQLGRDVTWHVVDLVINISPKGIIVLGFLKHS